MTKAEEVNRGIYIVVSDDFAGLTDGGAKMGQTQNKKARLGDYCRVLDDAQMVAFVSVGDRDLDRIERMLRASLDERFSPLNIDEYFSPGQLRDLGKSEWHTMLHLWLVGDEWQSWLEEEMRAIFEQSLF